MENTVQNPKTAPSKTAQGVPVYKYALCLVDIKVLGTKTFSYLIPDNMKDSIKIGQPVMVPFGNSKKGKRLIKAYVVGFSNYLEEGIKAKEIDEILDFEPMFDLKYLKMLEWVANYYFSDLPTVLKTALPEKFFQKNLKNYRKPNKELKVLKTKKSSKINTLSPEQEKVYNEIKKVNAKTSLLYGITGSGKTEIYFKLIEDTINEGKNVLFLAPEIALVSQLTSRTIKRFGKSCVGIWHSSISEAEKYKVWQKLRSNEIKILFGARSSVFAPIKNCGLIIIDEENDPAYKQTMPAPRYNAVEVAKKLAALYDDDNNGGEKDSCSTENNEDSGETECGGAKIILGSATPDIKSYYEAKNSNSLFILNHRYNNAPLPKVKVVDMRLERGFGNNGIFSRCLIDEIKKTVQNKRQVILLINRRGFSSYTQCMECSKVIECPKCAIPLIYHSASNSHRCHYCNFEIKNLTTCPECGKEALENFGTGTQRVEDIAGKIFEGMRIKRLDSDSLTKKNEHFEILDAFAKGEIDILIGTQMIAKGLDNPNVTLVGVINADLSFNLPDFRSSERGFSLLCQVAGRSGRGKDEGKVIFQTFNNSNVFLESAREQDYDNFYENEIAVREAFDYPPFSKIIRIILSSNNTYRAEKSALEIAMRLKDWIAKMSLTERLIVMGPAPCVIEKIRGEYRFNILIKNKLEDKGHNIILSFLRKIILPDDIKMVVDVDPTDIL